MGRRGTTRLDFFLDGASSPKLRRLQHGRITTILALKSETSRDLPVGSAEVVFVLRLLLLRDIAERLCDVRHCLIDREFLLLRHHPVDHLEVHDGLELTKHSIAADDLTLVDQELVVPATHLAFRPLDRREILQIDIDIGEVIIFGLRFLVELQDNCQSLLPEDLDRVDGSVEDWNLVLPPLLRLELLLDVNHALLIRDGVLDE